MDTNQTFTTDPEIVEDWNGGYKLEIGLTANRDLDSWTLDFNLPYEFDQGQVYGVDYVDNGDGSYTISGQNDQVNLQQGQSIRPIFIVDDNGSEALVPEFQFPESTESTQTITETDRIFQINSEITDDWGGKYRIAVDLTANQNLDSWTLDFDLPYKIDEVYGVDLVDNGDGSYTISNQNDLVEGESIEAVFIVKDEISEVLLPEFQLPESTESTQTITETEDGGKIIDVDRDFGSDLGKAIASANDGDVVQLGNNTYYTDGITIDKDITIDGEENSVINGNGTSESILNLTSGATDATIQDLEITNGNNGIYGQGASNLTLQNLDVNNIGLSQTIREGINNTGIVLNDADGSQLLDSKIHDIGRKGVGIGDTENATISNITVQNINLEAEHAQSHDAAGVKFFNTNDVVIKDSDFSDINANNIWNDTTNSTTIEGNSITGVGEDFLAPDFNNNVDITGIYNEKSSNSIVKNNDATSVDDDRFSAFRATEFTTETMTLEDNDFSSTDIGSTDYWVNESAEKLIATTENPDEANFSLFADEYYEQANIG